MLMRRRSRGAKLRVSVKIGEANLAGRRCFSTRTRLLRRFAPRNDMGGGTLTDMEGGTLTDMGGGTLTDLSGRGHAYPS
jgi:hypothetical protein